MCLWSSRQRFGGQRGQGSNICFKSDNTAVVHLVKTHTSQDKMIMHILRWLTFYAAFFRFQFNAEHVPGSCT